MIKYLQLLIIVFATSLIHIKCIGQNENINLVKEFFELKSLSDKEYPYIFFHRSLGRKTVEYYTYYKNKEEYVLAFFHPDSNTVNEKKFSSDQLFFMVQENLNHIKRIRYSEEEIANSAKNFRDTSIIFTQVGIRYKNLHYNHYKPTNTVFAKEIKNQNLKKGYQAINLIAAFFETQLLKTPASQ